MGCTTSKVEHERMDTDENISTDNMKQTKIDEHFSVENKADTKQSKTKQSSSKNKKYSDGDDNENDHKNRTSNRVTRSSTSLSPLRMKFDDSDDEDDPRYASYSQRDISEYRNNYPNTRSNSKITDNLKFYTNKIPSHPDGDYIDNIHKNWYGDYRKLEFHHGYIQWLFPLQERGLNWSAEPLQKHEIESIKQDSKALKRILKSYKMMLDFYGFELVDEKTGEIRRSSDDSYRSCFRNLNTSSHNYLRITRILKCLGEFDYEHLKFPFLERILYESIIEDTLSNCLRSCKDYWIETLRSQDERRAIRRYARELIDYRNKQITPPSSHHAERPEPLPPTTTTTTTRPTKSSKSNDSNDDNMTN
ncbi:hypothetical protein I4U23_008540 [Adineta vaga]|nr:hypothetical protein I4U23_008540 [Adineta vaga]